MPQWWEMTSGATCRWTPPLSSCSSWLRWRPQVHVALCGSCDWCCASWVGTLILHQINDVIKNGCPQDAWLYSTNSNITRQIDGALSALCVLRTGTGRGSCTITKTTIDRSRSLMSLYELTSLISSVDFSLDDGEWFTNVCFLTFSPAR